MWNYRNRQAFRVWAICWCLLWLIGVFNLLTGVARR
jgi:hypothetical protein